MRIFLGCAVVLGLLLVAGCKDQPENKSAPAKQTGTPPPSAATIPPPLPPGQSPGPAGMR